MRAVVKLERRFRQALEKLDMNAGADAQAVDTSAIEKENANLSKQITTLEAEKADAEKKIESVSAELTSATEAGTAASKQADDLKKAQAKAEKEVAGLQASLEKAQAEASTAATELAALQTQIKELETSGASATENAAKIVSLEAEIAELNSKTEAVEENSLRYFAQMRSLRGSLRQLRTGLKDGNVVNAEDINTALQSELDAIQTQRALDLNEVNIVLEKLTPLVEGK